MKNSYEGKITISRYQGGARGGGVSIQITDTTSGCEIVDLDMSVEAFAEALFGRGYQPCKFEVRTDNLGKRHEIKKIDIPIPANRSMGATEADRKATARAAVEPFEVDGWEADADDYLNHHRTTKDGEARTVTFHRWV